MLESPRRNRELKLLSGAILLSWSALATAWFSLPAASITLLAAVGLLFAVVYIVSHICLRKWASHADPLVLPVITLLTGLSLTMIYRLNAPLAWKQFAWLVIGNAVFIALICGMKNYRTLANYKYLLGLTGLALLFSTVRLGSGFLEPNLWLNIGPISFQPSEIAKILIVIFFAAYLSEKRELLSVFTRKVGAISVPDFKHLGPMLLFWAISLGLLVIQKDIGASLLFFGLFLVMLYVATGRAIYSAIGSLLFVGGAAFTAKVFSHVAIRLQIWLDPWIDPTGKSYQLIQSLYALASGGIWGSGLGRGFPNLIPVVTTDFIFSAFGEEIGLIGIMALLGLYLVFVGRGLNIAVKTSDEFGKMLAVGLTAVFAIQTFVIVGGVTRLVPLTGITLPFLSYGGSSILANFILAALLIIISNQSLEEASEVK